MGSGAPRVGQVAAREAAAARNAELAGLTSEQQALVREIFVSLHSPEYADKVLQQVAHDNRADGLEKCSVALFGEPDRKSPWGYRYEGHHLSLNVTVTPDGVATAWIADTSEDFAQARSAGCITISYVGLDGRTVWIYPGDGNQAAEPNADCIGFTIWASSRKSQRRWPQREWWPRKPRPGRR